MGKSIHYRSLAWDILRAVGGGAVVASLFIAPNIGIALAPFLREGDEDDARDRREWERWKTQQALKRLRERRYVRFEEKGHETYIVITEKGKQRLRTFEFNSIALPEPPKRWDRKWRVVVFDVPEKKSRERKLLRDKLDELGFLALQKSIFAYPHPCEDEIDFLTQFLDIDRHVHCLLTDSLGSAEGAVRKHFGLLLSEDR